MQKLVISIGAFLFLTPLAIPQTNVPISGSCVVTYNPDNSATLVCTTSLVVPAAPVSVTVSPVSTSIQLGTQFQFAAAVTGTGNQAVTWSATAGSISGTGLFTAPGSPGSVTVTATSVAYPTVYGSGAVTITSTGGGSGGAGGSPPLFTDNYCTATTSCTLNNVAAGDMLVIGTHQASPPTSLSVPQTISDSQGEMPTFDAMNLGAGLQTWHISPVVYAGTHTITVSNFGGGDMYVAEFTAVASGNPVEAIGQNFSASSSTDIVSLITQTANDLLFGFGRSAPDGSQQGAGFTAIRTTPTMEFAAAAASGTQTVAIQPTDHPGTNVGIQALAIRPAGSAAPIANSPSFTGNFCVQNPGNNCTINNVAAGNMLVISALWHGSSSDSCQISDSTGETIAVDRQNDTVAGTAYGTLSIATWHIGSIMHPGTHTISANGGGGTCWNEATIQVFEFTDQNSSSPIDAVSAATGSTGTAITSVNTSQGNDLIYAFCAVPDTTTSQTGNGFASIAVFPTVEYRMALGTAGNELASCPTIGNWVIEELAIKH